jgi:hypothetical protein
MSCGSIAAAGHVSVIRDLTDDQVGSGTVRTRIGLRYLYGRLTCLVVVGVNTIPCTSGQGGPWSVRAVGDGRNCRTTHPPSPAWPTGWTRQSGPVSPLFPLGVHHRVRTDRRIWILIFAYRYRVINLILLQPLDQDSITQIQRWLQ